ncbi:MAG: uroporphyrinogen-III C-methyltransferase [Algoriphagus sp.]|jgi:uroporphyrin-III C-methyltransferase|uniref:uroporphyrinogen-III C-methyltransferase n=1 Tax=Algoriphagus sp. TaxID=1872435 RepID=UPI002730DCE9|nr:uroporphyrinogen-III C-methyltransferase [Algoriphagus sp.]MDP2042127.1 uroporphyrinogen-III C-methyltransferase [Algoriphagus sp.]MDP3474325.1 uroporphyrinogen-III C-methyltransferase [Algoriphagus sp.]
MKISPKKTPHLTLIGAGPGDPELLTLKAVKALQQAEVVLYDALVNEDILDLAENAVKVSVGKRRGSHSFTQDEINQLIVTYAYEFGSVVRLKGGDPFVFGRGKEEEVFAGKHGVETTVIPGISSCVAVPASIGIPVTFRGISESFWVITGTNSSHELSGDIALAAQSSATVVILMGLSKIEEITKIYKDLGRSDLPIAIIQNGTRNDQREVIGTIKSIVKLSEEEAIKGPSVLVIGDVVNFAGVKKITEEIFACEDEFIFQNLGAFPF